MLRYPVILETDTNGTILVSFPDAPEAHTFGADRDEALRRAGDALETAFLAYIEAGRPIPQPSAARRRPMVTLPALTEAKIRLYAAMRAQKVSKAELARRLRCHPPQVDRLLDLRHASRLDRLQSAFKALGKDLTVEVLDAA